MTHSFEITWHGEDTDTMRAQVDSREALETLRSLISADPSLMISSVIELDQYGVPILTIHPRQTARRLAIDVPALVAEISATGEAQTCASGVGPSLCSRFPQCGHSSLLGIVDELRARHHTSLAA
ncbi:hypothetical protein [Streptomyces sp. NPDC091383]|uniref:hypothetical protein n=1 Tax=Streptomyces sp. NPDC091383 TaxID=3365996 RepID=UPI00380091BD